MPYMNNLAAIYVYTYNMHIHTKFDVFVQRHCTKSIQRTI